MIPRNALNFRYQKHQLKEQEDITGDKKHGSSIRDTVIITVTIKNIRRQETIYINDFLDMTLQVILSVNIPFDTDLSGKV